MPGKPLEIIFPKRATTEPARAIYDPAAAELFKKLGTVDIRRASNVEPSHDLSNEAVEWLLRHGNTGYFITIPRDFQPTTTDFWVDLRKAMPADKWWADLLRSNGPVLGPFATRDEGIEAELAWLKAHNYPTCRDCAQAPQPLPTFAPQLQEYAAARTAAYDRARIQIEPPTSDVIDEHGDTLRKAGDVITRYVDGKPIESFHPDHADYEELNRLFAADKLVR